MIRNPRNLLWLLPVILLVTSPLWQPPLSAFLQPRGDFTTAEPEIFIENRQNFLMDSVRIFLTSAGHPEWEIQAERAFTGKTDREIGMINVRAIYTGKAREETVVTSDRGQYFIDDSHLILVDNVVIDKPVQNQKLFTDLLHYYDSTKMAVSPGDVEIQTPKFTLQAGRMDYDLSTDGYDFSNGVKVDM
jgi:LPS export ABC transporter protein LptC